MRRLLPRSRAAGVTLLRGLTLAAVLCAPPPLFATESAATLWALNCRGCHAPPENLRSEDLRMLGQFAHTEKGRVFFIAMPEAGRRLSAADEARLRQEIFTWKRSCHVLLQEAPLIRYTGAAHVQ